MNQIDLSLKDGYLPGESLTGRVIWQFDQPQDSLVVSLSWNISAKDKTDVFNVSEIIINDIALFGKETFSFALPREPYSFSGQIMTLTWNISVKSFPDNTYFEKSFAMAPGKTSVLLDI